MGETKRSVSVKVSEQTYKRAAALHGSLPEPKASLSALYGHLIERHLDLIESGIVDVSDGIGQAFLRNSRASRVLAMPEAIDPIEAEIQDGLARQLDFNKQLLRPRPPEEDESERRKRA